MSIDIICFSAPYCIRRVVLFEKCLDEFHLWNYKYNLEGAMFFSYFFVKFRSLHALRWVKDILFTKLVLNWGWKMKIHNMQKNVILRNGAKAYLLMKKPIKHTPCKCRKKNPTTKCSKRTSLSEIRGILIFLFYKRTIMSFKFSPILIPNMDISR